jgi:hypothetical protein
MAGVPGTTLVQRASARSAGGCGTSWSIVDAPISHRYAYSPFGVTALAADDAWAVGTQQQGDTVRPLAEHWNGVSWRVVPTPWVGMASALVDVAAVSSADVWAVGYVIAFTYQERPLVEHWDGSAWRVVDVAALTGHAPLYSVAAIASDDVWAVGTRERHRGPSVPFIEHWDGTTWSRVSVPAQGDAEGLVDVAAGAPNEIWAGGTAVLSPHERPLILHYDGTSWTRVSVPIPAYNSSELDAVAAVGPGDVWAVGIVASPRTYFEHWDGTAWKVLEPSLLDDFPASIAHASATDVRVVGYSVPQTAFAYRWDGTAWSREVMPQPRYPHSALVGVAFGGGVYWAVGLTYTTSGTASQQLIERVCPVS